MNVCRDLRLLLVLIRHSNGENGIIVELCVAVVSFVVGVVALVFVASDSHIQTWIKTIKRIVVVVGKASTVMVPKQKVDLIELHRLKNELGAVERRANIFDL